MLRSCDKGLPGEDAVDGRPGVCKLAPGAEPAEEPRGCASAASALEAALAAVPEAGDADGLGLEVDASGSNSSSRPVWCGVPLPVLPPPPPVLS
mmetsp:Transcript_27679/g.70102  ORF Transcript_27679/g.70102 Transcript_27679/m.70102 type:complete len:94 (+) Transcript_27679:397-678(+)